MAMLQISMGVDGEKQLDRAIPGVMMVGEDMTPCWRSVADEFYGYMQKRFDSEGSHEGGRKWKDLSPAYKQWKLGVQAEMSFREFKAGNIQSLDKRRRTTMYAGGIVQVGGEAPGAPILHLRSWPTYRGILPRTPNLRGSFVLGGPGNLTRIDPMSVTMGTTVATPDGKYNLGLIHQRGGGRVPARPVIWLSNPLKARFVRVIRAFLTEQLINLKEARGRVD